MYINKQAHRSMRRELTEEERYLIEQICEDGRSGTYQV